LEYSREIFEKYPKIRFYEIISSVSRVVPWGRTYEWTGKQDKGNSRSPEIRLCVLCGSHNKQRLL